MMKYIIFIAFLVFNVIFGLSGIAVLGGGIYLIVKTEFNQYIIIIMSLGLIIAGIFVLGCFTWQRPKVLIFYMIFITIIFVMEVALPLVIRFHEETRNYIKDKIKDIINKDETEQDKIINVSAIIIGSAAACSFFSFILALVYYRKLKEKEIKHKKEKESNGDDILKGLDYTNLNPDISTI